MRSYNLRSQVLVTGGAGFRGSHRCERLLAGGDEGIGGDNGFTGSKRNIEHIAGYTTALTPPWQVPHRGKVNQPAWVRHVAEEVARLKEMPLEAVAEASTANFRRLFRPPQF